MALLHDAGWVAWVQIAATLPALAWTLLCAVLLGLRWKVPAVLSTLPLALHALLAIAAAVMSGSAAGDAEGSVDPSQRAALLAESVSRVIASGTFGVVVLPTALLLCLGGAAGGVRAPRSYGAPVLAFLACGLAAVLPIGSLIFYGSMPMILAKVTLYGIVAVPVALSLLGNGPTSNARESSVATAVACFGIVASMEMLDTSLQWSNVFYAIAGADPDSKGTLVHAAAEEISTAGIFGWLSLALASVPLIAAVFRPSAPPSEEELMSGKAVASDLRLIGTGLALLVPPAWIAARLSTDPSSLLLWIAESVWKTG